MSAAAMTMLGAVLALAVGLGRWTRSRVLAEQLDLVTFLLMLVALAATAIVVALLLPTSRRTRAGVAVSIVTTVVMLAGAELALRTWPGSYATYLERNEGRSYELQYHHTSPARYHVLAPNASYTHPRAEFAFPRTTNSLGLSEREVDPVKAPREFRLLALGDSYTEGVGTSYDETWIKIVERRVAAGMPERLVTTVNAGVSGSDPWYGVVLLEDKLLAYQPDVVFVAINASDVNDVIIRGGRERFGADGVTRPRPTPRWEWLYGSSFLVRHFVHDLLRYNSLFIESSRWQEARRDAGTHLLDAVTSFQSLAERHGFRVMVVFHPDRQEAVRQRYERGFAAFVDSVKALPGLDVVDVLERWAATGVLAGQAAGSLYWPIDGHNTPAGYAAFGTAVADAVLPTLRATAESHRSRP